MSHSVAFAFSLDFTASSVSVPLIAPEHRPRAVGEGTSLSANRPTVRSSESTATPKKDAPNVHSSISPTSDPSVPTGPQKASTAPGVRSLRTASRRPPNAFVLFRRHYLEVLRAREAAEQARHDAEQVLSDSPPTPSDIAPTLINGIDHGASASNRRCYNQQVANAWRAMSEAGRELFLQEAREAKARFDRELPAFVWNTRAADGAGRGPVAARREHPAV